MRQVVIEARDLLLHPVRLRIVQMLVGRQMTPLQLLAQLDDVPQATLYRHINQLAEGGLIEVVDERPVRGGVERTYRVVPTAVSLGEDELESATADDHFRYFATFVGALLADFSAYLEASDLDFAGDRVGYRQIPLWLSDEEFDAMLADIGRVIQQRLANEPTPGRRRRLFTTVVMPSDRPQQDG